MSAGTQYNLAMLGRIVQPVTATVSDRLFLDNRECGMSPRNTMQQLKTGHSEAVMPSYLLQAVGYAQPTQPNRK